MFLTKLFRFVPRSRLRRALAHFNRGEFEEAATLFDEVLDEEAAADDVLLYASESYVELGKLRLAAHDVGGALRAYERAAALRPGYADVQRQLGQLYEQTDQPRAAREAYERALAINPKYFEARLALSRLLMQQREIPTAQHHLEEAVRSGPEYASDRLNELVEGGQAVSPEVTKRLGALLDELLSDPPSPVRAGVEVAREALRAGDNGRAITELKRLVRAQPKYPDLHNLLGVAYDNEEMVDDAIEEFEEALHLNADFLEARINLGLTLFGRGRYEEAERHLRRVEKTQPDHKLVRDVLSQIEARGSVR